MPQHASRPDVARVFAAAAAAHAAAASHGSATVMRAQPHPDEVRFPAFKVGPSPAPSPICPTPCVHIAMFFLLPRESAEAGPRTQQRTTVPPAPTHLRSTTRRAAVVVAVHCVALRLADRLGGVCEGIVGMRPGGRQVHRLSTARLSTATGVLGPAQCRSGRGASLLGPGPAHAAESRRSSSGLMAAGLVEMVASATVSLVCTKPPLPRMTHFHPRQDALIRLAVALAAAEGQLGDEQVCANEGGRAWRGAHAHGMLGVGKSGPRKRHRPPGPLSCRRSRAWLSRAGSSA